MNSLTPYRMRHAHDDYATVHNWPFQWVECNCGIILRFYVWIPIDEPFYRAKLKPASERLRFLPMSELRRRFAVGFIYE